MPSWNNQPLGVVAPAVQAPFPPATAQIWNLSLEDIESGTGRVVQKVTSRVSELGSSKCSFSNEHVLYSKLRPYLNKVVVPDEPGVGTSELIPLRPRKEALDRDFLAWYLRSPAFLEFSAQNTRGANLPRIAMDALWAHKVPTPPLGDQRRIVARIREAMSRVDEVRRLRTEAGKEGAALVQAARYEAFQSDAPQVELGSLILDGPTNGLYKPSGAYGSGTSILRINNFNGGDRFLGEAELKRLRLEGDEARRFGLRVGDFIINRVNGSLDVVGKACTIEKLDEPTVFESNMMKFALDEARASRSYILHFLASPQCRDQIKQKAKVIQQASINQGDVRSFTLPLLPLAEQKRSAETLDAFARRATSVRAELSENALTMSLVPSAILRKAFAGEL
jgi:type I restriction enzyme S subunit